MRCADPKLPGTGWPPPVFGGVWPLQPFLEKLYKAITTNEIKIKEEGGPGSIPQPVESSSNRPNRKTLFQHESAAMVKESQVSL